MPYGLQVEVRQAKRRWFEYEVTDLLYTAGPIRPAGA